MMTKCTLTTKSKFTLLAGCIYFFQVVEDDLANLGKLPTLVI